MCIDDIVMDESTKKKRRKLKKQGRPPLICVEL
jgi:hypothetical protein